MAVPLPSTNDKPQTRFTFTTSKDVSPATSVTARLQIPKLVGGGRYALGELLGSGTYGDVSIGTETGS